ncbi:hypothetical protein CCACVL1_30416 [Corchorus capsularis]|uniref:Uncharacterized protein n=1 Tax=Corchorus capsularis TaxID=210143 RepID=A0A1R3FXF8_COCAP|nr:hypothetical protein CCACVL1_30416 [Corchorus capsularis]
MVLPWNLEEVPCCVSDKEKDRRSWTRVKKLLWNPGVEAEF